MSFSPATTIAAACLSLGTLTAPVAVMAASGPGYQITLQKPNTEGAKVIVREALWSCSETQCKVSKATSRPEVVCATAARKLGPIANFTANGQDFTAEQLTKCNAKAK